MVLVAWPRGHHRRATQSLQPYVPSLQPYVPNLQPYASQVRQLSQLSLELAEKTLRLEGCGYKLDAPLPLRIDPDRAAAKFSAKSQRLKITVPEA